MNNDNSNNNEGDLETQASHLGVSASKESVHCVQNLNVINLKKDRWLWISLV
jgi:hypothetical protein